MTKNEKAPLWRHVDGFHGGIQEKDWFKMKVERSRRTPMSRQIEEGVEILKCRAGIIMNAKGEWNGSKLPRLLVERGDKVEVEKDDPYERMWREDCRNHWEVQGAEKRKACDSELDRDSDTSGHSTEEVVKNLNPSKRRRLKLKLVSEVESKYKITDFFRLKTDRQKQDNVDKEVGQHVTNKVDTPVDVREGFELEKESRCFRYIPS